MYRQIFTVDQDNINIPIPREWKGLDIEVLAFPVSNQQAINEADLERRKRLDEVLDKYLVDLSDFKFNRDEANIYV